MNGEHVDLFSTSDGQLILVTSTGTYRLVKEEIFLVNATGDRKIRPPQQSYHDKKSPRRYPLNDGTFISVETDGDFILNETNRPAIHLKTLNGDRWQITEQIRYNQDGDGKNSFDFFEPFNPSETVYTDGVKEGNSIYLSTCLLYTSPSPRDRQKSRMPSSA